MTIKDYIETTGNMIYNDECNEYIYAIEFDSWVQEHAQDGYDVEYMHYYKTERLPLPNITLEDLDFICECNDYMGYEFGAVDEDDEGLDKINEIFHSMLKVLFTMTDERLDWD